MRTGGEELTSVTRFSVKNKVHFQNNFLTCPPNTTEEEKTFLQDVKYFIFCK